MRAQTVAVETLPLDSEEEDDDDDDDDFELPPLSSLISKLPKSKKTEESLLSSSPSAKTLEPEPGVAAGKQTKVTEKKQTTLKQSLGRMTKLYVPRKSQPGFFKEVDVSVDEADVLKEEYAAAAGGSGGGRRAGVWRRSDVSYIDLTGED